MIMCRHCKSPYPNFAHQLFISPSKHLYLKKKHRVKWQNKAMEVTIYGIEDSGREHLVHYIISGHYSAAFYAEIGTSKTLRGGRKALLLGLGLGSRIFLSWNP